MVETIFVKNVLVAIPADVYKVIEKISEGNGKSKGSIIVDILKEKLL